MSATSGRVSPSPTSSRRCSPGRSRARRRAMRIAIASCSRRGTRLWRCTPPSTRPDGSPARRCRRSVATTHRWEPTPSIPSKGSTSRPGPSVTGSRSAPERPWRLGCSTRRAACTYCSAMRSATRARSGRRPCSPPITGWRISWPSSIVNGQQALGYTGRCSISSRSATRWRAFGWHVHEVDGHDVDALAAALSSRQTAGTAPRR